MIYFSPSLLFFPNVFWALLCHLKILKVKKIILLLDREINDKFVENQNIDRKEISYHSLSVIVKENRGKTIRKKSQSLLGKAHRNPYSGNKINWLLDQRNFWLKMNIVTKRDKVGKIRELLNVRKCFFRAVCWARPVWGNLGVPLVGRELLYIIFCLKCF